MADSVKTAELFDVDMDELTRPLALISTGRLGWLQRAPLVEPQALQHPADGGGGDTSFRRSACRSCAGGATPRSGRPWPAASADADAEAESCGPVTGD